MGVSALGYRLRRKVGDIQGVGVSALGYRLRRKVGGVQTEKEGG